MMCCEECGVTDNFGWVTARRAMRDEPGRDEGWECLSCGAWKEDVEDKESIEADERRKAILEGGM